eukprot:TRINITY_DN5218_c0_g1_i1.p1 TRINITY_DN5218_c0_g1~~TRINITY_DN5218_c0_g1_i1.p1  ORF type:complete len:613 (+),score=86.99 TRINITY_DN5218_c0_g1_i1:1144-2982(+)
MDEVLQHLRVVCNHRQPLLTKVESARKVLDVISQDAPSSSSPLPPISKPDAFATTLCICREGGVTVLLSVVQKPSRDPERDFAPISGSCDAMVMTLADEALMILMRMHELFEEWLAGHCWRPVMSSSDVVYRHSTTNVRHREPWEAVLNGSVTAEEMWPYSLLSQLPLLLRPGLVDGVVRWAARVVWQWPPSGIDTDHGDDDDVGCLTEATDAERQVDRVSVIDVLESDSQGNLAVMRQLVVGVWHGVNEFRESETDMCRPLGDSLENWYTVTLAGLTLSCTRGKGNVLMLGLGGGSIPAFLQRHSPSLSVSAVELSRPVAFAAVACFGLKVCGGIESLVPAEGAVFEQCCRVPGDESSISSSSVGSSFTGLGGAFGGARRKQELRRAKRNQQNAAAGDVVADRKIGSGCAVTIGDAMAYLQGQVVAMGSEPSVRYSVIIVDVYTSGRFPPSLLRSEFFELLRGAIRDGGAVLVNAGIGTDADSVVRLMRNAFGDSNVLTLRDGDGAGGGGGGGDAADGSNTGEGAIENLVVVGYVGEESVTPAMGVGICEWDSIVNGAAEAEGGGDVDVPFRVHEFDGSVIPARLAWGPAKKLPPTVAFTDKAAPEWDLFD